MTKKPRILAFAGSLREHSISKRVLKTAVRGAQKAGAEVTYVDLRDYPMPIYDEDDHERNGFNENALEFQRLLTLHDGLLIASPEYNGSLPAGREDMLKLCDELRDRFGMHTIIEAYPRAAGELDEVHMQRVGSAATHRFNVIANELREFDPWVAPPYRYSLPVPMLAVPLESRSSLWPPLITMSLSYRSAWRTMMLGRRSV